MPMTQQVSSIGLIAPDGNRVIGFVGYGTPRQVLRSNNVTRYDASMAGDWPFQFDRVYAFRPCGWRGYAPDDLPKKWWG